MVICVGGLSLGSAVGGDVLLGVCELQCDVRPLVPVVLVLGDNHLFLLNDALILVICHVSIQLMHQFDSAFPIHYLTFLKLVPLTRGRFWKRAPQTSTVTARFLLRLQWSGITNGTVSIIRDTYVALSALSPIVWRIKIPNLLQAYFIVWGKGHCTRHSYVSYGSWVKFILTLGEYHPISRIWTHLLFGLTLNLL